MGEEIGVDLTLANGKKYSPENLNLDVLMNMKNIQRGYIYTGVPPKDNFSLEDHSMCCYIMGNLYFDWLERKGKNEIVEIFPKSLVEKWGKGMKQLIKDYFSRVCLTHDFGEVVTGDLVPSFKNEEYRKKEKKVKGDIEKFLNVYNREDPVGIIKKHLKVVDIGASLWEIKKLEERGYKNVSRIRKQRIKKLEEYDIDFDEVKEFYEEVGAL